MIRHQKTIASLVPASILALLVSLIASSGFAAPSSVSVKGQARFLSTAPLEKIVGTAPVAGGFTLDFKQPETAVSGSFKVPVAKMKTGNDMRDDHLRSAQWLNAEKCPNIEFTATKSKLLKADVNDKGIATLKLEVMGKMMINCVSQPLSTTITVKRKEKKIKVGGKFEIKLADFQVKGKKGIVGKKVGESIQVSLNLTGKMPK